MSRPVAGSSKSGNVERDVHDDPWGHPRDSWYCGEIIGDVRAARA